MGVRGFGGGPGAVVGRVSGRRRRRHGGRAQPRAHRIGLSRRAVCAAALRRQPREVVHQVRRVQGNEGRDVGVRVPQVWVELRHALACADLERLRGERDGRRGSASDRPPNDRTDGLPAASSSGSLLLPRGLDGLLFKGRSGADASLPVKKQSLRPPRDSPPWFFLLLLSRRSVFCCVTEELARSVVVLSARLPHVLSLRGAATALLARTRHPAPPHRRRRSYHVGQGQAPGHGRKV